MNPQVAVVHDIRKKYDSIAAPPVAWQDLVVGQWYVQNNGLGRRFPIIQVLARNPNNTLTIQEHPEERNPNPYIVQQSPRTTYHLYIQPGNVAPVPAAGAVGPAAAGAVGPAAAGAAPAEHELLATAYNAGTINVSSDLENSILRNSFEEGENVVRLNDHPSHIFHKNTIHKWFRTKATNPLTGIAPTRVEVGKAHIVPKGGSRRSSKKRKQKKTKSRKQKK